MQIKVKTQAIRLPSIPVLTDSVSVGSTIRNFWLSATLKQPYRHVGTSSSHLHSQVGSRRVSEVASHSDKWQGWGQTEHNSLLPQVLAPQPWCSSSEHRPCLQREKVPVSVSDQPRRNHKSQDWWDHAGSGHVLWNTVLWARHGRHHLNHSSRHYHPEPHKTVPVNFPS